MKYLKVDFFILNKCKKLIEIGLKISKIWTIAAAASVAATLYRDIPITAVFDF